MIKKTHLFGEATTPFMQNIFAPYRKTREKVGGKKPSREKNEGKNKIKRCLLSTPSVDASKKKQYSQLHHSTL